MKKLNEKEWGHVLISGVFPKIKRGKRLKKADHVSGYTPYVSSTAMNNGVDGYIEPTKGARVFNHCISLANSGSVGSAFYEPFHFVASDHVTSLKNDELSDLQYLFLTTLIKKQSSNFNFNREINDSRISKMQIMVPINEDSEPDYNYMSQYAEEKQLELLSRFKSFALKQMCNMEYKEIPLLEEKKWGEFLIGNLFYISRPAARSKDDYSSGDVPFVASGAINNGVIKCCVSHEDEELDKGNCITVSPVDGSTFYQPMNFLGRGGAGSSILLLKSKSDELNLLTGQFMAKMIQHTCSKYTYGRMGNKDTIKRERIMLPITSKGEPDYDYMEQYSQNMMLKKYNQYLSFLRKQGLN